MNRLALAAGLAAVALAIAAPIWHARVSGKAISTAVDAALVAERARVKAATDAAKLVEDAQQRDKEAKALTAKEISDHESVQREQRIAADRAVLRSESEQLRAVIAAGIRPGGGFGGEGPAAISLADASTRLGVALSECSARRETVAGVADGLTSQVIGLQAYITRVVGPVCIAAVQ